MANIARKGDEGSGICSHPSHDPPLTTTGTIITGYANVQVEGQDCARVGDFVEGNCGHTGTINSGNTNVIVGSIQAAQLGSTFIGDFAGTIITASNISA